MKILMECVPALKDEGGAHDAPGRTLLAAEGGANAKMLETTPAALDKMREDPLVGWFGEQALLVLSPRWPSQLREMQVGQFYAVDVRAWDSTAGGVTRLDDDQGGGEQDDDDHSGGEPPFEEPPAKEPPAPAPAPAPAAPPAPAPAPAAPPAPAPAKQPERRPGSRGKGNGRNRRP